MRMKIAVGVTTIEVGSRLLKSLVKVLEVQANLHPSNYSVIERGFTTPLFCACPSAPLEHVWNSGPHVWNIGVIGSSVTGGELHAWNTAWNEKRHLPRRVLLCLCKNWH